ncbi:MAG: hypothetical protein ACQEQQ_11540, partial [Chloroflexota bacterium]
WLIGNIASMFNYWHGIGLNLRSYFPLREALSSTLISSIKLINRLGVILRRLGWVHFQERCLEK